MLLQKCLDYVYNNYINILSFAVIVWLCTLQWYTCSLSAELTALKNENVKIQSKVINNTGAHQNAVQTNAASTGHKMEFHRNKRRRRGGHYQNLLHLMNESFTEFVYLYGEVEQNKEFFSWNASLIAPHSKIKYNQNGTFTFKKRGYFLVFSQILIRGQEKDRLQSYGYETVHIPKYGERKSLMGSYITQERRGLPTRISNSNEVKKPIDSLSHSVIRYFEIEDQIGIQKLPRYSFVNYTQSREMNFSYIGIVQIAH